MMFFGGSGNALPDICHYEVFVVIAPTRAAALKVLNQRRKDLRKSDRVELQGASLCVIKSIDVAAQKVRGWERVVGHELQRVTALEFVDCVDGPCYEEDFATTNDLFALLGRQSQPRSVLAAKVG